ncbi:MAG: xanthine dehydrogenase family protein [Caldilineaceae bacterium SB0675_bin_29]|uniref:Xanthine dehydrogenase family protein n=1 Tax=Caldilineaceae bacterium SB0675_bin_29 TaxID=2605266 RepID=A0A6B1FVY5_9CHLR|nr:xanthine dehydrogenase family protein [Caldilineaceae bacterium SB0675_bin_29]
MSTRQFGQPIKRNEDPRLLAGRALFTDDVQLAGMLHVAFLRSDLAHARIRSIDLGGAKERPGVAAVYTADDLGEYWQPGPLLVPPPPVGQLEFHPRTQVPLAKDKVRHAGEAVAVVVAESRYLAEDELDDIFVDYEPLDAVVDLEDALESGTPLVHDDLGHNINARGTQTKGDWAQAEDAADLVIRRRFHYDRGTAAAIENRGIVASWDDKSQQLTIWDTTQAPIAIRNGLAGMLGLSEHQVRVIAPFIGGGFGPKIMMFYPEEVLLAWATLQLGRPLKWIEDREENFYATTQERGQVHDATMALKNDGTVLGIKDVFLHDAGAYAPYGLTLPISSQCTLLGPYVVPEYHSEFTSVFTNKPIVTPYRGAGRQHGVFVMERLLDIAAKELGIDPISIRRKNYIQPDQFPYSNEIIFQDFTQLTYDSGNYEPALDRALELIGYQDFIRENQPRREAVGERVGISVVSYIEGTGIGPYEGARVTVEASGKVSVATGVGTQGQGHYTSFAQVVADQIGVAASDVHVVTGDTDLFYWGAGTFASRGAVVAGNAMHAAATKVRDKILKMAGEKLEAAEEDLELIEGRVQVKGVPQTSISIGELAVEANPMRGAVRPGTEPGLEATEYYGPERGATASGVHAMILRVDPETFLLEIEKYVVVHDCGTVINPLILEGQIQGGVAQGIGNAFYEQLHFDENGALRNASLMDYLLPTAADVPNIVSDHMETPSPLNPLGVKGAGEAGAIPVGALFAQALDNAFRDIGLEVREIPLSPNRLFELVTEASARGNA